MIISFRVTGHPTAFKASAVPAIREPMFILNNCTIHSFEWYEAMRIDQFRILEPRLFYFDLDAIDRLISMIERF